MRLRILRFSAVALLLLHLPCRVDGVMPPTPARQGELQRCDIILVTLDTLRADALGFMGNARVATPLLDRLAGQGRVFERAHAHNVVTLPSHTNILTGLYPYQHGIRDNEGFRLDKSVPTLATRLKAAGWATAAFVAAYPLDSSFGLDRGFEVYDDAYPRGDRRTEFALPERRGDEVVAAALEWWNATTDRPRFLWLHLFDPHAPYDPPEPFASRYATTPYLGEVAATDHYLTPLLAPLLEVRTAGDEPSTLVVLTADHGEALGDHGELTHGLFAYESTLAVPLVVWGSGVEPGRDRRWARHVDIVPTVLDAVGLDDSPAAGQTLPGRSLLGPPEPDDGADGDGPPATYFEAMSASLNRGWAPLYGQIVDGQKLIALPLAELYDLDTDPGETKNLVREQRARAAALRDRLPPREQIWPRPGDNETDTAASETLRSLGYLGGSEAIRERYGPEDDPKQLIALDRAMHQTIELYSLGRHDEAAELARGVVAERPTMALGHSLLAQALLEGGRRDEALAAMHEAQQKGVASPVLLRQLALTLAEIGHHDQALALLEPLAAEGGTEDLDAWALALSEAGRQDEAETVLRRVMARDPDDPVAHEQMALVELRRGRWAAARDAAHRALALNERLHRAWNNLGVALYELGEVGPALDAWQRATELDPGLFDALYNLGTRALQAGDDQRARAALERFVAEAPAETYTADLRRARVLLARLARQEDP